MSAERLPSQDDTTDGVVQPGVFADTGEVGAHLRSMTGTQPAMSGADMADEAGPTPEDLIEELVRRITRATRDSKPPPPPPPGPPKKTFLGFDWKSWIGWAVKGIVVVAVFLVTWYKTVNRELAEKPSYSEVEHVVLETVDHAMKAHYGDDDHEDFPSMAIQVEENAGAIQEIKESQIRQEGIDKTQTQVLQDIKDDVRYMRRGRRGDN